ncbi:MAG TPA: hypothetical protein PLI73_07460 [Candidatus Cloacimonadota bacterium]|nr:hypothetical protein [Candidatus Cloacimonadota bacterium]
MSEQKGRVMSDKYSSAFRFVVANSDLPLRPEVSPDIYEEFTNPGHNSRLWKGFCQFGVYRGPQSRTK